MAGSAFRAWSTLLSQSFPRAVLIALSCASAAAAAACASVAPGSHALAGTNWIAQSIDGRTIQGGRAPRVNFGQDHTVAGTGGCNSFGGSYQASAETLRVSEMARTEMACAPPIMAQEDAFLAALGAATRYDIVGERLTISAGGAQPLIFSRASS